MVIAVSASELQVQTELDGFDVAGYVAAVRATGRRRIDPAIRTHAAYLHRLIERSRDSVTSAPLAATIRLAEPVLHAERRIQMEGPRYASYANLRVLSWAIGTEPDRTVAQVEAGAWSVIRLKLSAWCRYEVASIAGWQRWNPSTYGTDHLGERVRLIAELLESLGGEDTHEPLDGRVPVTFDAIAAAGPGLAVEHLTVLPQTTDHEEVAFLHCIHISECGFWGMLVNTIAAVECLGVGDYDGAADHLRRGARFGEVTDVAMRALVTMPPQAFLRFGGLTGTSSGIQSRPYQLLQLHLFGPRPREAALAEIAEVADLSTPRAAAGLVSLRQALTHLGSNTPEQVVEAARALDQAALRWRSRHKAAGDRYLPDTVVGGAEGRAYLGHHYRDRLLPASERAAMPASA